MDYAQQPCGRCEKILAAIKEHDSKGGSTLDLLNKIETLAQPCQQPASVEKESERKHLITSAGYWFKASRQAQREGKSAEAIMCMENAYNHAENAYASKLQPPSVGSEVPKDE